MKGIAMTVAAGALGLCSSTGCEGDGPLQDAAGMVSLALVAAPPAALCTVITATAPGQPTVTRAFELAAGQSSVFSFGGLPTGVVELTQQAFTVRCSVVPRPMPTWVSDPVTVTLRPGVLTSVTMVLRLASASGQVTVRTDFPGPRVSFDEFSIPTAGSQATAIASGGDGHLWFTSWLTDRIGRITTSGTIQEFPIPPEFRPARPRGICLGTDGHLWIAMAGNIGRISPSGAFRAFPIPLAAPAEAFGITSGPDGNIWFTVPGRNTIVRLTPAGSMATKVVPTQPRHITAGAGDHVWFTGLAPAAVGLLETDLDSPVIQTLTAPPTGITGGPDGAVWFSTEEDGIGRWSLTDGVRIYPVDRGELRGIVLGADGALWFTQSDPAAIGRMTVDGAVTRYLTPSDGRPTGIALGMDGALWYTDTFPVDRIGRVRLTRAPD
jgi:streptogramin lyase